MTMKPGWKILCLKDAFWFQEGPGVRKWQFTNSGIKLLNVANITKPGQLDLGKTDRHLSEEEVEQRYKHFLVDDGDLVIASSGISFDTDGLLRTRGAFIEKRHLPLCMNTSTIRFKAKDGISDLSFLKHWLDSREFRVQITRYVTGSAQQNFGPSHLSQVSITLPPLDEQRRIAAILDKADALREKRRQALAKLDTLLQAVFLEMFGDPVVNPKGWEFVEMGKTFAVSPNFGTMIPPTGIGEWLSLRVGNIQNWNLDLSDSKYVNLPEGCVERHSVRDGDVLMARAIASRDHLGKCIIVYPQSRSWAFDSHLMRLRFNQEMTLPEYVRHLLMTPGGRSLFLKKTRKSTVQYNINTKEIASLRIPLPPINLQKEFQKIVSKVIEMKERQQNTLIYFDLLFQSLQQRAFAGEFFAEKVAATVAD